MMLMIMGTMSSVTSVVRLFFNIGPVITWKLAQLHNNLPKKLHNFAKY